MESQSASAPPPPLREGEVASSPAAERRRVITISILIMTLVAVSVGTIFMLQLYRTAFEQQRGRLVEIAQSRARLIEAVARFDARYSAEDVPGGAWAATLSQIKDAHARFSGFGETGEFTLARREGDWIVFLLSHRHELESPRPHPFQSKLAEPMRRALAGESGTVVGLDYRGVRVLAAYGPLVGLDVGIVAKIDLAEIRAPFIRASLLVAAGGLGIIGIGASLFLLGVNPLIRRTEEHTEELRRAYDRLKQEVGERKQAEEELKSLTVTLEQRVAERTRELEDSRTAALNMMEDAVEARRELAQVVEELARSNAELEQFAYVASHDLQEPLRMVASYTQLLGERYRGKLDADADDFIGFAVDGAQRMQRLIEDLLAFSRVGTRGVQSEPTDSGAVLDSVLADLRAVIEEGGAVIRRGALPTVRTDGDQLGRVFQNLLSNAVKFRGEGPLEIDVGAEWRDGEWVFWVSDNGPGMEAEYAERIFVIFQQLHPRNAYPGTGIGLAICKRIVERQGGCIWVESEPGKGATFYFTIPDRGSVGND